MEKILSGWKDVVQNLEEVARKIKYQEDINAYLKEMNELEKTLIAKDDWLKNDTSSASQSSAVLKDLCQVNLAKLVNFDWKLSEAQDAPEELGNSISKACRAAGLTGRFWNLSQKYFTVVALVMWMSCAAVAY